MWRIETELPAGENLLKSPAGRKLPSGDPGKKTGQQRQNPPGCKTLQPWRDHGCQMMDSNQRRQSRRIYNPLPLAARAIWHAPFGALVTLLRVAPTYANRQLKQLSGSYPARPAGSEATPPAIPGAPRRSPSSGAAPESPGSRAAWPAHPRRTGGSAARPQRTSRDLRSHG